VSERALRAPAFLVLTALAAGPQHGYGVVEDVRRISGGRVRLHTGTLYAILDRLREGGLSEVDREEIVSSRLRRYYRLTGAGADRLAREAEQMQRDAREATHRLRSLRQATGAGAL
jgi:DNA-binding PadR family transcriptional regulator